MTLPHYINCNLRNGKIIHCEYFMHPDCPETCDYARDIRGINAKAEEIVIPLGIGSIVLPPNRIIKLKKLEELDNGGLQI